MQRHRLDVHPEPRDKAPLYINEPWIIETGISGVTDGVCLEHMGCFRPLMNFRTELLVDRYIVEIVDKL